MRISSASDGTLAATQDVIRAAPDDFVSLVGVRGPVPEDSENT